MKTYDRDIDYLGEIGRILRDLSGYSTLAHELIQNAHDDGEAADLVFGVCSDALLVQHDGALRRRAHAPARLASRKCP